MEKNAWLYQYNKQNSTILINEKKIKLIYQIARCAAHDYQQKCYNYKELRQKVL